MRDRILSRVLLPAPLRPMMPTTSPWPTSNETSRSAQIASLEGRPSFRPRQLAHAGRRAVSSEIASRSVLYRACLADAVLLAETFDPDRVEASDDVRKRLLHPPEVERAADEQGQRRQDRDRDHRGQERSRAEQRPAETLHDADHRIEAVEVRQGSGSRLLG